MLQDQNKLNDYRDKNLGVIDVEQLARAQFKESSSDNNHVSITPPPQLRDNLFDIFLLRNLQIAAHNPKNYV